MDASLARKTFDLTNDIKEIDPQDAILKFDADENRRINREAPWTKDPHFFKSVKISAVALIKMVIHARSGGIYEIMGLMHGKVMGTSLVIVDSFALPVQGTETRVNAANEANEYMVQYLEAGNKVGRLENAIGWYHSHPGYGCWLSGIDVNTQLTNQKYQDPFVAVVIDPNRTISAGKVDIGAFRTYPEDYKPPSSSSEYQSIPLSKIEDFGVHANQYYSLEIEVFKSKLDDELLGMLWNKYWVNTLSQSPLISNRAYAASQLNDLAAKLSKAQASAGVRGSPNINLQNIKAFAEEPSAIGSLKQKGKDKDGAKQEKTKEDTPFVKAVKDSSKITSEAQHGLISQMLKDIIFSEGANVKQIDSAVETALAV